MPNLLDFRRVLFQSTLTENHVLFDSVVGKKDDKVHGSIELGARETDLLVMPNPDPPPDQIPTGGASDLGEGKANLPQERAFRCSTRVFNVVMNVKIKHKKAPGANKDPEDKFPPTDGLAEVHLRVDVDP